MWFFLNEGADDKARFQLAQQLADTVEAYEKAKTAPRRRRPAPRWKVVLPVDRTPPAWWDADEAEASTAAAMAALGHLGQP